MGVFLVKRLAVANGPFCKNSIVYKVLVPPNSKRLPDGKEITLNRSSF